AEPERRLSYRDDRRPLRDREAALRVPDDRLDDFLAVDFFAVDLRAVDFFAADLRAVDFFAVDLRAVDFFAADLRAVDFFADDLRAVDFFAVDFRAVVFFFATAFFLAPAFFAVDFLAVDFLAVDFFRAPELRVDPERELLPEERDEERVVAGTATARSISAPSLASPIADSPQLCPGFAVGSLHEPAIDVSDVSPVPLQSSWVM